MASDSLDMAMSHSLAVSDFLGLQPIPGFTGTVQTGSSSISA